MAAEKRYLEKRRQTWYAVVDVPPSLHETLGRKRLRQSLRTRDINVARVRRHEVVGVFKTLIAKARVKGSKNEGLYAEALANREYLAGLEKFSEAYEGMMAGLDNRIEEIEDKQGEETALQFYKLSTGQVTPIEAYIDRWLNASTYTARTKADHRHALSLLQEWLEETGSTKTLERINDRVASDFRDKRLLSLDARTANKALSGVRSYWRWLVQSGFALTNPWLGKNVPVPKSHRESPDKAERAFTREEVLRLLSGDADPTLADIMRIAALSGMRIEEICQLRTRDCVGGVFSIERGRTAAARRKVPIHSELSAIVARRLRSKDAAEFLLEELEETGWDGARSMAVSKRFGYYRKRCEVHDVPDGRRRSRVNFHSFRRWFITEAERAGQPPWVIEAVVGHKRQGMSLGRYSAGASPAQLKACVGAVRLPAARKGQIRKGKR